MQVGILEAWRPIQLDKKLSQDDRERRNQSDLTPLRWLPEIDIPKVSMPEQDMAVQGHAVVYSYMKPFALISYSYLSIPNPTHVGKRIVPNKKVRRDTTMLTSHLNYAH